MPSDATHSPALRSVAVRRRGEMLDQDLIAVEEPLEIRLDGKPLVVTMRTPGDDEELAAGFLHAEGMIAGRRRDRIAPRGCGRTGSRGNRRRGPDQGNRLRGRPRRGHPCGSRGPRRPAVRDRGAGTRVSSHRRLRCVRQGIDRDLDQELPSISPVECRPALFEALPERLRTAQTLFEATGGIHAAGIFTLDGELLRVREDIGRHNAVDKVIGHFVLHDDVPLRDRILVVSGRAGFELVQKALMAAIPAMVSVGAASSVAVDMATAAGMTLYSFAGRGRGNLHVARTEIAPRQGDESRLTDAQVKALIEAGRR